MNRPQRTETPDFEDEICTICGSDPSECQCPECPKCGVSGDPNCYLNHGMGGELALKLRVYEAHHAQQATYVELIQQLEGDWLEADAKLTAAFNEASQRHWDKRTREHKTYEKALAHRSNVASQLRTAKELLALLIVAQHSNFEF